MKRCDVCGNEYDKPLEVKQGGRTMTFDCFECAVHAMAPSCAHCGVRILGHGVEAQGATCCSAHCAHQIGIEGVADRVQ